jgi:flagellar motility protein MotE (MotC chaperone)
MYSRILSPQLITLLLLVNLAPSLSFAENPPAAARPAAVENNQNPKEHNFKSVEERRLYTVLQNERDSLDEEKKVLALKEKELKTLQMEADKKLELLNEKLAELQETQRKIEKLLAKKDAKELRKTKELSLIYAKMNPGRAALAMATLDQQLAADLLANMKIKAAAKILDRMDKVKASQLSTTFTTIKVE